MGEVSKLWVPESPVNQAVKLECLKIAAEKGAVDCESVIRGAQKMYEWVTKQ